MDSTTAPARIDLGEGLRSIGEMDRRPTLGAGTLHIGEKVVDIKDRRRVPTKAASCQPINLRFGLAHADLAGINHHVEQSKID